MVGKITVGRQLRQKPINTAGMDRKVVPEQHGGLHLLSVAMCANSRQAENNEVGHRPIHQEDRLVH